MADLVTDYMHVITRHQPLTFEEEQKLAKRWLKKKDKKAFDTLMQSYLRLVVKVAMGYKGYGLPVEELVQEGNIGLMQAINKFEPAKGFRLSTYAMWWIKAQIQEYILNNWSMIRIGTSGNQKKLFFNLRRLRNEALGEKGQHLTEENLDAIADELKVNRNDVRMMDQRLRHGDESLNVSLGDDDGEGGNEWQDFIVDTRPNQEVVYSGKQIAKQRHYKLMEAIEDVLDYREKSIFVARHLTESENTPTLESLADTLHISRERVRQLEERAFKKVQAHMRALN